jgi:hypothetical protein
MIQSQHVVESFNDDDAVLGDKLPVFRVFGDKGNTDLR